MTKCCTLLPTGQTDERGRFVYRCPECNKPATHRRHDAKLSRHCGKPEPAPDHGPGTELKAMIRDELGIDADGCKRCKHLARAMDRLGVKGVRMQRDWFVARLKENADRRGWATQLTAALGAIASGLAFRINPLDRYGSLIDEACRRAELKTHSA